MKKGLLFLRSLYIFSLIFGLTVIMARMVGGADTAVVNATVTAQKISVSVSDGQITYGTMALESWKSTLPGELNDKQTATNDGNVTENFKIKGQNSSAWTLASTPGNDQYTHQFCNNTDNDCSNPPTNYSPLSTDYQTLKEGVVKDGTVEFHLRLGTPTATSSYDEQTVNVTVMAEAAG